MTIKVGNTYPIEGELFTVKGIYRDQAQDGRAILVTEVFNRDGDKVRDQKIPADVFASYAENEAWL